MGYNSDDKIFIGEVGCIGVTVNSLKDFEKVFEGISLDNVSTSMTINAPTAILLAMYIIVGEKQGVKPDQLEVTVQNNILKEYIARGTYIFPPKPSLYLTADVIEYCSKNLPRINTISISGYHMRGIIKSLKELKEERNEQLLQEKLKELKKVALWLENIMPIMIEIVKTYATIQEICDVLREVFGEFQNPQIF